MGRKASDGRLTVCVQQRGLVDNMTVKPKIRHGMMVAVFTAGQILALYIILGADSTAMEATLALAPGIAGFVSGWMYED